MSTKILDAVMHDAPAEPPPRRHVRTILSRRDLLAQAGAGFGGLALAWLLARGERGVESKLPGDPRAVSLLRSKPPMLPARAKSVIFLFMYGGPSQMDTFDPKPELTRHHGQRMGGAGAIHPFFGEVGPLLKSPFKFRQYGKSGRWVSELFPCLSTCVDDMAFVHSMTSRSNNHAPALFEMNTGYTLQGHPSMGSWVTYGLGSENENLPAFVVMTDAKGGPIGGAPNWSSGFMPAAYQGTLFRPEGDPILDLSPAQPMPASRERARLDLIAELNASHRASRPGESELDARIAAYELAYRMQLEAPGVIDLHNERPETLALYGINQPVTDEFGRKCLTARRLVERGVRFVQLYSGGSATQADNWDAHENIVDNHTRHAARTDLPIAGLLKDLKRRGLLDETLVVWGGEFGRLPISQKGRGRDHNPNGFTVWMAGAGIKPGVAVGQTDELGYRAVVDPYGVHDLHATILSLMGLDDMRLTYLYNGRNQRLTENGGQIIKGILA